MTKDDFFNLLRNTSTLAYDIAKSYVLDELPLEFRYDISLNISTDDPSLSQFDIYPNDTGKTVEIATGKEVVELLCRNGKVPVWIDISVERVDKAKTIFRLLCAGRYADDANEFYYNNNGTGPFGIKSPTLPVNYIEGNKFKLKHKTKKSIFDWLTRK